MVNTEELSDIELGMFYAQRVFLVIITLVLSAVVTVTVWETWKHQHASPITTIALWADMIFWFALLVWWVLRVIPKYWNDNKYD